MGSGGLPTGKPGVLRSLGQFAGHIVRAVREPADTTERHETGRRVEQREGETADGRRVTLRRTTIDEVEIEPDQGASRQTDSETDTGKPGDRP